MDGGRHPRRPDEPPLPPNYPYIPGMHPQAPHQQRTAQQQAQQQQLHQQQQQQPHHQQQQQQQPRRSGWSQGGSMDNRYQPAPLNTSAAAMGQRDLSSAGGYHDAQQYYPGSAGGSYATSSNIPQSAINYQQTSAGYTPQDARHAPGYPSGNYQQHPTPNMMYNVPQAAGAPNAQVYDTSQQYGSRQPAGAGLPLLNPDVGAYYQGGPSNVSSAASALHAQVQAAGSSSGASHAGYSQQPNLQSYANMTSMGGLTPQTSTTAEMAGTTTEEQQQAMPVEEDPSETFGHYEAIIREAFREIRDGDLATASETVVTASSLLRDGVARFGLVSDDSRARPDRISVWRNFNNAWLSLLQRQKDMVESHQQLGQSQSILTLEALKNLGKTLIELSDVLERHGLVDYEMGVWEERIEDILEECIDLYERTDPNTSGSS